MQAAAHDASGTRRVVPGHVSREAHDMDVGGDCGGYEQQDARFVDRSTRDRGSSMGPGGVRRRGTLDVNVYGHEDRR